MKPFNLEAAKQHHPIQTRNGSPAKFLMHVPEANNEYRVVVLVDGETHSCSEDGIYYSDGVESSVDLFMAPLGQIEGRDVYPGDEMYHKLEEEMVKVIDFTNTGVFAYESSGGRNTTVRRNLTWAKPKTKREGWINVYPDFGDALHPTESAADRKACSDRIACVRVEYEF